jgi:hypothetical protein
LLDEAVVAVVVSVSSAVPGAGGGMGSGCGESPEGEEVGVGVDGRRVGVTLVGGMAFKFTFFFCQRCCIDLFKAFGPWLTRYEDSYQRRGRGM